MAGGDILERTKCPAKELEYKITDDKGPKPNSSLSKERTQNLTPDPKRDLSGQAETRNENEEKL